MEERPADYLSRLSEKCKCCRNVQRFSERIATSSVFSGITTVLTIYALFGDDMRLLFTQKPEDWIFDVVTYTSLSVFALEILVCSLGKAGYLFGFFFTLDVLATVTLLLDVSVINESLFGDSISNLDSSSTTGLGAEGENSADAARAARVSRVGSKAGRVVRLIRLMRLIRLFKPPQKGPQPPYLGPGMVHNEDDDDEGNVAESAVSRKLSEMTTQRVIMLVLLIMLSMPFLQPSMYTEDLPSAAQYGIDHLFRFWHEGLNIYLPLANSTALSLYLDSNERRVYVDEFLQFIFYHNPFCEKDAVPSSAVASPLDSFGLMFWIGASSGAAWSATSSSMAELFLPVVPTASVSRTVSEWNNQWGGASWPYHSCNLTLEAAEILHRNWNQTQLCLGRTARGVSLLQPRDSRLGCPENLRYNERSVTYPSQVTTAEWDQLYFMFVFDRRAGSHMEALLNIFQTLWICFLLGFGAMTFSNDANKYVLAPIERMIAKVDKIRENPLAALSIADEDSRKDYEEQTALKPEVAKQVTVGRESSSASQASFNRSPSGGSLVRSDGGKTSQIRKWVRRRFHACRCCRTSESPEPMETVVLEKTIIKIGSLLALGFGEAGAEIIGQNMKGESSATLNAMVPGRRVDAIFGFCDIRNFTATTEVLQDQVMVFVNRIAGVVHSCANEFFGSPNKNIGNAFLLTWRLSGLPAGKQERLADMSLVALAEIIARTTKSPLLAEYRTNPQLVKRVADYKVRMGFGLHYGWAIEGALGSDFKVDASYLGPNVNMASRLEEATQHYRCLVLVSDALQQLMSEPVRQECRLIDHIQMEEMRRPFHLYTLDLDDSVIVVLPTRKSQSRRAGIRRRLELQRRKLLRWSDDFEMHELFNGDSDIAHMRVRYTAEFFAKFHMAFLNYEAGEWTVAKEFLEACLSSSAGSQDGPSRALLRYMERQGHMAPEDWPGFRVLLERHDF